MSKICDLKSIIIVILWIFVVVPSTAQEDITLPYRLFRSEKAETTTEAVPLVIFLHGAGERGNDNNAQLKHCVNYFLDDTITNQYLFLLLVPQCPEGKRWVNTDWSLPEHQMESEPPEIIKPFSVHIQI